jgi:hypothetical protein
MAVIPSANSPVAGPSGGNIADVVGLILDKGLVIDAYVRVSLIGIEILTIDARVVTAGVDTYLRFAEAAGRLNLEASRKRGIPELISSVTGVGSRAPASLEQAPDTALPAGATPHDDDVVALAPQREKERRP